MRRLNVVAALAGLFIAATAAATIFPHLLYGKRIAGQVVDAVTREPIAGAHVALLWRSRILPQGFTGHNARDICYHAAAAVTSPDGQFESQPWKKWSTYDVNQLDPIVLIYAPHYVPVQKATRSVPHPGLDAQLQQTFALTPYAGSNDQRIDMLFFGLANQGCDYGGLSQKSLYPMLQAIYEEVRAIAESVKQIDALHAFAVQAAYAALALDPNGPGRDAEVKAFIEEHLK